MDTLEQRSVIMSHVFQNNVEIEEYYTEWEVKDDQIYLDSANIYQIGIDEQSENIKSFAMCLICYGIVKTVNDGFACSQCDHMICKQCFNK